MSCSRRISRNTTHVVRSEGWQPKIEACRDESDAHRHKQHQDRDLVAICPLLLQVMLNVFDGICYYGSDIPGAATKRPQLLIDLSLLTSWT